MAWTDAMKEDFDLKVYKVLCAMLPQEFNGDADIHEQEGQQKTYVTQWLNSGAKDQTFETVADALIEFQRYIQKQHIKSNQAQQEYVEMSMTFNYGTNGGVISWRLGSQFMVSSPNDRLNAQSTIWQALRQMKDDFERQTMLRMTPAPESTNQQTNTFEEINCSKLIVDVKDGKVAYKVKGGKFEKWGVRVFPDVLQKVGIEEAKIPLVGVDLTGYSATILMKGRNPDKVTKLVKVG